MTNMTDESIEDKMQRLRAFTSSYNKKKDNDKIVIGFGNELDLDYGCVKAPIESLSALLAKPGKVDGGFPLGMYTTIGGPERVGKSTLCWQTIALDQQLDSTSIWAIVAPEALDKDYMEMLGVDMNRIFVIKDGLMEDVMQKVIDLSKMKVIKGFVIDSIGALTPKAEVQDSKGKEHDLAHTGMLDLQRKMGQFFRMSNTWVSRSKAACILISHVYQDPNNNGRYVVKGGNAVKHFAHVRLKLTRVQDKGTESLQIMPDGMQLSVAKGHDVIITLEKSKQNGNENKSIIVPYRYGIGLDAKESAINMAVNLGVIDRSGAWYTYKEEKVQGRTSLSELIKAKDDLYNSIITDIQVKLKDGNVISTSDHIELEIDNE